VGCVIGLAVTCSCSGGKKAAVVPPTTPASAVADAKAACLALEAFVQKALAAGKVDATSLTASVKAATKLRTPGGPYATLGNDIISALSATDLKDNAGIAKYGAKVQQECVSVVSLAPS
jgi:hypothetical protein